MTFEARSLKELSAMIEKHQRQREKQVMAAARKAAARGRGVLKRAVPVAFGEIRESVHTEDHLLVVDAPHAAAVNNGSRPHWAPLEPLIAWVRLRGTQGLLSERQVSRLPGTTTASSAKGVADMLSQREVRGPAAYSPVDAAVDVARAIQLAIANHGTKPHHFIEKAMPELNAIFADELRKAIEEEPK